MINWVILRIHVDEKIKFLAMPSSGELVKVQGMGVKKNNSPLNQNLVYFLVHPKPQQGRTRKTIFFKL